jgi:hypothetical protein
LTCLTAALLAACATNKTEPGPEPLVEGFTCCNLHYNRDWISDLNRTDLPLLPAGLPAQVTGYGHHRVYVKLDGSPYRLGHDYGRNEELLSEFAEKYIVAEDPRKKIASYPADVQNAIRQGRVMRGMTKEQVVISLGYPITRDTLTLDEPVWRYWHGRNRYQVVWGPDGRVLEIAGEWRVLTQVVWRPRELELESRK